MQLTPIYIDNHLLVVHKPAGVLSQEDETGDMDLLTLGKRYLKNRFHKPGNVYLGLVHRLDRPVSGLMVFARTSKAAARLSQQFKRHQVTKSYLAIVSGTLQGQGRWRDFLVKDGRRARVVAPDHPKGKEAILSWRVRASQGNTTLVDIQLETGRAHQIRLQFASRNHPLVGDLLYGSDREFDGRNLALHSYRLGFKHPVKNAPIQWLARPPATWQTFYGDFLQQMEWRSPSRPET